MSAPACLKRDIMTARASQELASWADLDEMASRLWSCATLTSGIPMVNHMGTGDGMASEDIAARIEALYLHMYTINALQGDPLMQLRLPRLALPGSTPRCRTRQVRSHCQHLHEAGF